MQLYFTSVQAMLAGIQPAAMPAAAARGGLVKLSSPAPDKSRFLSRHCVNTKSEQHHLGGRCNILRPPCIKWRIMEIFRVFYLSENGGGVNATPVVVTFEGQKVFAIVFLQGVRAARRGSNAQLSRNVLPGFLFCALWVEQEQTCVEKNRNPIW